MWFDSHAHITSLGDDLIPEVMKRAKEKNVNNIVNVCTNTDELTLGFKLQKKYPQLHLAGAITPHDVQKLGYEFEQFEKAAIAAKLVAIGETGLDYYYEHSPKKLQQEFFLKYIHLSLQTKLPLIIHCRDAFEDLLSILIQHYFNKTGATNVILHCFTGNKQNVNDLIEQGVFISFSGIVTFTKSEQLRETVKIVPSDLILVETDTPYLAPHPYRGKPNEPAFIPLIGQTLAEIKEVPIETIANWTRANAKKVFGL